MSDEYAGEISPKDAWDMLAKDESAQLIDVRTEAEFEYVGVTDLSDVSKEAHEVSWQTFPGMAVNPDFADEVAAISSDKNAPLLFLCRTGGRSLAAAKHMTAQGYTKCYNVTGGFEGAPDDDQHRGNVDGWKADGLPWEQF